MKSIVSNRLNLRSIMGGAAGPRPKSDGPGGAARRPSSLIAALAIPQLRGMADHLPLVSGRIAASGLGFLTWLVTARLYPTEQVGLASGVVSAMMLCVQVALFGVGAAVISVLPEQRRRLSGVLNTAFGLVVALSLATAVLALALSAVLFRQLGIIGLQPAYAIVFLAIVLFGTVNVLMDHVSIATRSGGQVLARNCLFGVVAIASIAAMPLLGWSVQSLSIVSGWMLAGIAACSLGLAQLRRSLPEYTPSVTVEPDLAGLLVRTGLPNYLLTLAERAPNWVMPIAVTELLSPTDNAHWYAVWMMAWVVFLVPISVGQNLFAEVSRRRSDYLPAVRRALRTALLLGVGACLGAILLGGWALGLLGPSYAAAGTIPLRVLALAVVPVTFVQAYYALCRGTRRLREATIAGLVSGLGGIAASLAFGIAAGLTGMAVAWLVIQLMAGAWAGLRLYALARSLNQVGLSSDSSSPLASFQRSNLTAGEPESASRVISTKELDRG